MDGWIQLHRRILDWDWYSDVNTKVLFIHLLLKANFLDKNWKGTTIKRGQVFTSIKHLSVELRLSEKQIRTSLKKLITTQEVASKGANDGTMLTVCNYDSYQCIEKPKGEQEVKQGANEGQTKGDNVTSITSKQDKKEDNVDTSNKYYGAFCTYQEWLKNESINVCKLSKQLTVEQFETLIVNYGKDAVKEKITEKMDNTADLKKRYSSVFRTANNWLKDANNKKQ